MNIFEKAAKLKLRFASGQGELATEDLFDLSLPALDTIAKRVNSLLKNETEESFIPSKTRKVATNNDLRLEILKHVIEVRVAEQEAKEAKAVKQARLARLKELAADKADEQLASQSLEDLRKQIEEMEAETN